MDNISQKDAEALERLEAIREQDAYDVAVNDKLLPLKLAREDDDGVADFAVSIIGIFKYGLRDERMALVQEVVEAYCKKLIIAHINQREAKGEFEATMADLQNSDGYE